MQQTGLPIARRLQEWDAAPLPVSAKKEETALDKDRLAGSAKQAKGAVEEAVGKVTGGAELEAEGKADKAEGQAQSAFCGMKDAVGDAIDRA